MPARHRPDPASTRPGREALRAHATALQPSWALWNEAAWVLWRGLEVGMDMQQQALQRWSLRQQEWVRHVHSPGSAAAWLDGSLAAMRWTLQEWQQAWQDAMAAPLILRGDLRQDQALRHAHAVRLDQDDPLLDLLTTLGPRQMQAWVDLWSRAGGQRQR